MDSQMIIVHGKNMHYLTAGSGILFLHGVPGACAMWQPIMSKVSPHAECIALDLLLQNRRLIGP